MKGIVASFGAGGLFAVGLGISGMTKPGKVIGFLDPFGAWDASLAFVMVGAVTVYFLAHRLITRRSAPLFDSRFRLPVRKDVDGRLVMGAAIFGVGWALGGYCPGPAVVSAAGGAAPALAFVISMLLGMKLEHLFSWRLTRSHETGGAAKEKRSPPPRWA